MFYSPFFGRYFLWELYFFITNILNKYLSRKISLKVLQEINIFGEKILQNKILFNT